MTVLDVRNLTVSFNGLVAVSDLTFSVEKGERLVLFGPNGAGKTTLFNAISGFYRPAGGAIYLFDKDISKLSVSGRAGLGLGRTFQITNLMPEMNVLESAMLALMAGKRERFSMFKPLSAYSSERAEAERLLSDWGLATRRDTLIKHLSYGEQRQVELVLAIAKKPSVLLLDEPAAGLSISETEIVEKMVMRMGRDVTILLIEHDVEMATRIADRMIVLENGRYVTSGLPQEITSNPEIARIYFGEQNG